MGFKVEETDIQDVKLVIPERFKDRRGFFSEIFRADQFHEHGLPDRFLQLNQSGSVKNVVRGLHFQWEPPMGKLMRVAKGEAFLVAVDLRPHSPLLGKWFGLTTSADKGIQLWAPACFARGFCVLSDYAEIEYLCTGIYNSAAESGVLWNDPEIGIKWPVEQPIISNKDKSAQTLADWLHSNRAGVFDSF
jgi:dTDP-4-dehydrorhamnose 3,5-epimerase